MLVVIPSHEPDREAADRLVSQVTDAGAHQVVRLHVGGAEGVGARTIEVVEGQHLIWPADGETRKHPPTYEETPFARAPAGSVPAARKVNQRTVIWKAVVAAIRDHRSEVPGGVDHDPISFLWLEPDCEIQIGALGMACQWYAEQLHHRPDLAVSGHWCVPSSVRLLTEVQPGLNLSQPIQVACHYSPVAIYRVLPELRAAAKRLPLAAAFEQALFFGDRLMPHQGAPNPHFVDLAYGEPDKYIPAIVHRRSSHRKDAA